MWKTTLWKKTCFLEVGVVWPCESCTPSNNSCRNILRTSMISLFLGLWNQLMLQIGGRECTSKYFYRPLTIVQAKLWENIRWDPIIKWFVNFKLWYYEQIICRLKFFVPITLMHWYLDVYFCTESEVLINLFRHWSIRCNVGCWMMLMSFYIVAGCSVLSNFANILLYL